MHVHQKGWGSHTQIRKDGKLASVCGASSLLFNSHKNYIAGKIILQNMAKLSYIASTLTHYIHTYACSIHFTTTHYISTVTISNVETWLFVEKQQRPEHPNESRFPLPPHIRKCCISYAYPEYSTYMHDTASSFKVQWLNLYAYFLQLFFLCLLHIQTETDLCSLTQ